MSHPRSRILGRLRRSVPAEGGYPPQVQPRSLDRDPFDWDPEERLRRFRGALEAVRGEVHLVGPDWPERALRLLRDRGATRISYGPGGEIGAGLEEAWRDLGGEGSGIGLIPYREPVESFRGTLFDGVDAGITGCRGAIAETGTLVLWPDAREPRLLSLVPPIHLVLLGADSIRSTLAGFIEEQGWRRGMPSNALLISGPSKSADIEQTLAYGVHGPKDLIVLVRVDTQGGV
jgi:L-lactate dehydrogenase complex protein LldG